MPDAGPSRTIDDATTVRAAVSAPAGGADPWGAAPHGAAPAPAAWTPSPNPPAQADRPAAPGASAAWTPADTRTVVLWGLVGGVVAALLLEFYWWGLNTGLPNLPYSLTGGFLGWGIAAPLATTHALYAGAKVGKPGATIATIGLSAIPVTVISAVLEPLLFGYEGGLSVWLGVLQYAVVGMVLVAATAEVVQLLLKRMPQALPARALLGLSPVIGWTVFAVVQRIVPIYGYPFGTDFGVSGWLMWFLPSAVFGYIFSGLIPAAIAGARTQTRPAMGTGTAVSMTPSVGPYGAAPASLGFGQGPAEHPRANTVLVFGIIGMVAFAPLAIAAWVMGAKAKREMKEQPGLYRPSGGLEAGYVLGIIGTILWILGLLFLLVVYGSILAALSH